jgi:hypothetical protein
VENPASGLDLGFVALSGKTGQVFIEPIPRVDGMRVTIHESRENESAPSVEMSSPGGFGWGIQRGNPPGFNSDGGFRAAGKILFAGADPDIVDDEIKHG